MTGEIRCSALRKPRWEPIALFAPVVPLAAPALKPRRATGAASLSAPQKGERIRGDHHSREREEKREERRKERERGGIRYGGPKNGWKCLQVVRKCTKFPRFWCVLPSPFPSFPRFNPIHARHTKMLNSSSNRVHENKEEEIGSCSQWVMTNELATKRRCSSSSLMMRCSFCAAQQQQQQKHGAAAAWAVESALTARLFTSSLEGKRHLLALDARLDVFPRKVSVDRRLDHARDPHDPVAVVGLRQLQRRETETNDEMQSSRPKTDHAAPQTQHRDTMNILG